MVVTRKIGTWFEAIVPEHWTAYTVDEFLRSYWQIPKKQLHEFRMNNSIAINGKQPQWNAKLEKGSRLSLEFFKPEHFSADPYYFPTDVLYEDDHLLVLNKPARMDTHPNSPDQANTLLNAAVFHMQSQGQELDIRHIHRLDRHTSGAVLFSKHKTAGAILDRMLKEREVKRTYLAKAEGLIKQKKGKIDKPIGKDRHHPTRRRVSSGGQSAVTHYEVIQKLPQEQRTLITCKLDTGRTHQIRVHLSDMGYPLAGDVLYGGSPVYSRQALHAAKLELIHPFTEEKITVHAPFPEQETIFKDVDIYSI
ncbi:RluA family pseudouridine synthase [Bacillus massilinigeriensis]|uniref:RluA family pseudouridine synthase n=1 Tax=Bacillus mediterraneensis TaxID=1805474 RepID=UPI0008F923BC|nr:RluA family pseudouridine synthase [Bacillus mediterraneensis]